jgi:hypothetical protein
MRDTFSDAVGDWQDSDTNEVKEKVGLQTAIEITQKNYYINLGGSVGTIIDVANPVESENFDYAIKEIKPDDIIIVNGTGGSSAKLWGFLDANYKMLARAAENATATDLHLTAPATAKYIVINDRSSSTSYYIAASSLSLAKLDKDVYEADTLKLTGREFQLVGKGNTVIPETYSERYFKVVNGNTYNLEFGDNEPDFSGINNGETIIGIKSAASVSGDPSSTYLVKVQKGDTVQNRYTFTADTEYLYVIFRYATGKTLNWTLTDSAQGDLSLVSLKYNSIKRDEELENEIQALYGDDNVYSIDGNPNGVYTYFKTTVGKKYVISILTPNLNVSDVANHENKMRFGTAHTLNGSRTYFYNVPKEGVIEDIYEFNATDEYGVVLARANTGETFQFVVNEVSANNIETLLYYSNRPRVLNRTYKLSYIGTVKSDIVSKLQEGEFGLMYAYPFALIQKQSGGGVNIIEGTAELAKCEFSYYGNIMKFTADKFWVDTLSRIEDNPTFKIVPDYDLIADGDWEFTVDADGNYTIIDQVYAKMDALVSQFPTIVKKYDPMASENYTEDGITVYALPDVLSSMTAKGYSDYPFYMKGIDAGTYTIGAYTDRQLLKTPAYKTYVYCFNSNAGDDLSRMPKRNVYISAACQGDEPISAISVYNFFNRLLTVENNSNAFQLLSRFNFWVIPCLEGYGLYHNQTANVCGLNINRNYPTEGWALSDAQDKGLAAGDQFEIKPAISVMDYVKPAVAIDVHNFMDNLAIGMAKTGTKGVYQSCYDGMQNIVCVLSKNYPEYFGTKHQTPAFECDCVMTSFGATGRDYFFSRGIMSSATVEGIRQVNFIADASGNSTAQVRRDTMNSNDSITISELVVRNQIYKICEYNLLNFE